MDTFTRNYAIGLVSVIALVLAWLWLNQDSRVAEINAQLATDLELEGYPYSFRVLSLESGIAVMSSPRSAEVAAMHFLRTAYPALRATSVVDPQMMAAQAILAEKQSHAAELVTKQSDVTQVRWVFDERWFRERGVFLDLGP